MEDNDVSRKAVLRQQSYKLAQQQTVLPPLPGGQSSLGLQGIGPSLDHRVFRPISDEESRLHVHEEEDEEDETECVKLEAEARLSSAEAVWQSLPVTLGDCKLTDSKTSLSRLSPLSHLSHLQTSLSPSPNLYQWDENRHLHLPQPPVAAAPQESMDTSPTAGS